MKYRKLGNTGLIVSEVALGTMQFGGMTTIPSLHFALLLPHRNNPRVVNDSSAGGRGSIFRSRSRMRKSGRCRIGADALCVATTTQLKSRSYLGAHLSSLAIQAREHPRP
jgi:hypothetical protein